MESHESENKHPSKEKQMSIGRKKFNMDPKKGNWKKKILFHALMKIKKILPLPLPLLLLSWNDI